VDAWVLYVEQVASGGGVPVVAKPSSVSKIVQSAA
jgi:hypothetical protein